MEKELMRAFAKEFDIPLTGDETKIWFFRTQSGSFYYDFLFNHYIALGWDLIGIPLITNPKISSDGKKEEISDLYPDEKRPGLILSQMDIFYHKMRPKDLEPIPK